MKKLHVLFILMITIVAFNCKKTEKSSSNNTNTTVTTTPTSIDTFITSVPSTFTRKALIEYRTGIWCGACPNASNNSTTCEDAFPDRVYVAALHTPPGNNIEAIYNLYDERLKGIENEFGYTFLAFQGNPAGTTNRDISQILSSGWYTQCQAIMNKPAKGGIAIKTVKTNADTYTIDIYSGFNIDVSGFYHLQVYLIEDSVQRGTNYNQRNYDNNSPSSPFYGLGDPLPASAYKHNHTIEKALEPGLWGFELPKANLKKSVLHKKSYTIQLKPEWNPDRMKVLAFISYNDTDLKKHDVVNAQQVKLGQSRKWD